MSVWQLEGFAATNADKTPVTEHRIFKWGVNETTQGPITLTKEDAPAIMKRYEQRNKARGGKIDIDYFHLSRKQDARKEDKISAGECRLELRDDGIWAVDIEPTEMADEWLKKNWVRSYSPTVKVINGKLTEIMQMSLTNIPSMDDAGLLAAEDMDGQEIELSTSPLPRLPLYEGPWSAVDADSRLREFLTPEGGEMDLVKYRKAFLIYNGDKPEAMSEYKFQVVDVQDVGNGPELVLSKRAIQAVAAILQGARGGANISDADREAVKSMVSKAYAGWDAKAPWEREQEEKMGARPFVWMMADVLDLRDQVDAVIVAAKEKLPGYRIDVEQITADSVVVCAYFPEYVSGKENEKYFQMTYSIEDGNVMLGQPIEVVCEYKPKSAMLEDQKAMVRPALYQLAESLGMRQKMDSILAACQVRITALGYSYCYIDECYDDYCICSCSANEPIRREALYKIPYKIDNDGNVTIESGMELVELVRTYKPKAEMLEAQVDPEVEKAVKAHAMLLEQTGTTSTVEALVMLDNLKASADKVVKLEAQVVALKAAVQASKVLSLEDGIKSLEDEAKTAGKWTAQMAESARQWSAKAVQLGEDAIDQVKKFWDRAPVVLAPETIVDRKHESGVALLSDEAETTLKQFSEVSGTPIEVLRANLIADLKRKESK